MSAAALVLLWTTLLAAAPWQAQGWSHRALVEVAEGGSHNTVVAAVGVTHAGVMQDDADDVRVFDDRGAAVPYEVAFHDPRRRTLLLVRGRPGGKLAVYFGNADAAVDPMRAVRDVVGTPRAGPGAGGWVPRAGLVLTTMRRPVGEPNPTSVETMRALIAASPGVDGAALVPTISHGLNPFGDSDNYISVYSGWLDVPRGGRYGFCTASNEASFSFLDGKDLIHWPGRHTEDRGRHGEQATTVDVEAGPHHVTYLHEDVALYQVAFLGWRPPGNGGWDVIPADRWVRPHPAKVLGYEEWVDGTARATVMPTVELVDSVWPKTRASGQWTRYDFGVGTAAEGWEATWRFGDGATATGTRVTHVYLAVGDYQVEVEATQRGGARVKRSWPVRVYPVEHMEEPYRAGDLREYAKLVAATDPAALTGAAAVEAALLLDEAEDVAPHAAAKRRAAQAALGKSLPAEMAARMHLVLAGQAGAALSAWTAAASEDEVRHLRAAIEVLSKDGQDAAWRTEVAARLVRALGVQVGKLDEAGAAFDEAVDAAKNAKGEGLRQATRRLVVAMGDAELAAGQAAEAAARYRLAESLNEPVVPAAVAAAKVGAMPELLAQHVAAKRWDDAALVLGEWFDRFPTDVVRGEALYWLGVVTAERGTPSAAVRPLQLAARVGRGATFEDEARYRLTLALRAAGDDAAARRELEVLAGSLIDSPWRDAAQKELGR